MTDAQKAWLQENPRYSLVREVGIVVAKKWADQGYLWPNGRFSADDGDTLFWEPHRNGAVRVGREYAVV